MPAARHYPMSERRTPESSRMTTQVDRLVQDLRRKLVGEDSAPLRDAEVLRCFAMTRAEEAFAHLVERHGPMILGVCRRILHNTADADDAFQATFLVLARQARRICKPDSLASWLHGTALRLALNMKRDMQKRRMRERQVMPATGAATIDPAWCELLAGLDEELQRLPVPQRQPLLLCYLEGLSQQEAADQLGLPRGTLKRRLERGRELLRARLTRRGLTLAAALLATLPAGRALAQPVPATLASATVSTACRLAAGGLVVGTAAALAHGLTQTMLRARLVRLTAMLLLVIFGCGVAVIAYSGARPHEPPAEPVPQAKDSPPTPKLPPPPANDKDEPAVKRFEALAGQMTIFQTQDFAFGRPAGWDNLLNHLAPKKLLEPWAKVSAAMSANRDTTADVVALLKHKDPRVRTLALAVLYDRQDARQIPHLALLMGDTEKTAPELGIRRAIARLSEDNKLLPQDTHEQTVGQVAQAFIDRWLEPAGFRAKDFGAYWAARKDRASCASWFMARVNRAGQGTTGYDKMLALTRLRAVRNDVDALPRPDRDWLLIWLTVHIEYGEELSRCFAEPKELLAAGKRLGPDRLMDLIQGKAISDDPDMAPGPDRQHRPTHGRDVVIRWVLQHAGALLRPADAPALLEAEKMLPERTPWCVLAAAELQPAHAGAWLHAAFARFAGKPVYTHRAWQRAELAAGLWRIVGASETGYLADWFFGEQVAKNPHSTQTGRFLDQIKGVRAPADRTLVARLITDPRLDKLDYQSLESLIRLVNGWSKQPVVSDDERRAVWERGGWGPETPRDFAVMAKWRANLRASVQEWVPAAK
jgi:RNA polymerase sigma factor (sigma-70 family)